MPIPNLLSFSVNARVCNPAATNWMGIGGEALFLLAAPPAQYFTAATVSHTEDQRRTYFLFPVFDSPCFSSPPLATFEVHDPPAPTEGGSLPMCHLCFLCQHPSPSSCHNIDLNATASKMTLIISNFTEKGLFLARISWNKSNSKGVQV